MSKDYYSKQQHSCVPSSKSFSKQHHISAYVFVPSNKIFMPINSNRSCISQHGCCSMLILPLHESKLKFWPVRLRFHNLHVNFDWLQNAVGKATIHLFNLLLLLIYIPFPTSLFSSCCQIYRSFYPVSVRGKRSHANHKWETLKIWCA